jgi:hypothetical protein
MTRMEESVFEFQVKRLARAFNQELSPERIQVYWEYLSDLETGKFIRAIGVWIKRESHFPTIAEIRGVAESKWL